MTKNEVTEAYEKGLWRIYSRPIVPEPWSNRGNLPWDDPEFSRRMLREHLDESHGAASRITSERLMQIDRLWSWLGLGKGSRLLDVTCGPGLYALEFAQRGCRVTGIDFGPAAIAHAQELAKELRVDDFCHFIEQDVRTMSPMDASFDAATFIYGQLAVFPRDDAKSLLSQIARALRPGGRLCIEMLDQDKVDKKNSTWWFTDDTGLWGDRPFLHLGERFWLDEIQMSIERFQILSLEDGEFTNITLCDQTYAVESMVEMLKEAGFIHVDVYPAWDGTPLYDAGEWIVYIGHTPDES
ncbi:MAG: methyltransferase domain-containing protein [Candidatus Promineifilaceae bacterium]